MTDTFISLTKSGAENLGYTLSDDNLQKLWDFYQLVVDYNKKVNLTAILDEKDFVVKHILDSISGAKYIAENATVCDLGAGAGFPSIPLKIIRKDIKVTMLDALNKRVTFLNLAIEKLGLSDICALHLRAEDAGRKDVRESFDSVVARAVATTNILLEYAMPLLKVGGNFICYKGRDIAELELAKTAEKKLFATLTKIDNFTLPHSDDCRNLLIFNKTKRTSAEYPRTFAQISKSPL